MNNEQFIVIGKLSRFWLVCNLCLFSLGFMIGLFILGMERDEFTIIKGAIVGCFLIVILWVISFLSDRRKSKNLILLSDSKLIINKSQEQIIIPLSEINSIKQTRYRGYFKYGVIIIYTNSMGVYKVNNVYNIDDVKTAILLHLPRRYIVNNSYYDER